jgi:HPt (histidine-containing phosphotransfer) domain-containing protein
MPQNPLPKHGLSGETSVADNRRAWQVTRCNLNAALARLGGDRELLAALIEVFLEDGPPLMKRLESAFDSGDRPALHHAAHHLRGLASNFDADDVTEPALCIEKLASSRADFDSEADASLEQLDSAVARLTAELRNYRP